MTQLLNPPLQEKNNDVFLSFNYAKGYSKEATAGYFICLSLITWISHYRIRDWHFCWDTQHFPIKGGLFPFVSPPDSHALRKLDSHWADMGIQKAALISSEISVLLQQEKKLGEFHQVLPLPEGTDQRWNTDAKKKRLRNPWELQK